MCIWKVEPEKRHCEFCSYRRGCEEHPLTKPIETVMKEYATIMSDIIGADVLQKSRLTNLVWGRYFVQYQLFTCGYSKSKIGKAMNMNHATVINGIAHVNVMLEMPNMYEDIASLWNTFQERLSLKKNIML